MNSEKQYLNLLQNILENGIDRSDRTNIGTKSLFCPPQLRFDLRDNIIPLLTTKRVPWKTVIIELLWFLRGETDAKILQKENVHIWDGNSSREFLDKRGLTHYPEGVLGPTYGSMWRHFGSQYDPTKSIQIGGYDQIDKIINILRTDPFSRRLVVTAWNPLDLDKIALPPCHLYFEFYVTPKTENESFHKLSLHFHQRSADMFLGEPFNIFSYAVLLRIIALKVNMLPYELVATLGDAHIYKNHINQALVQIEREPFPFPTLHISEDIINLDFDDINLKHFIVNDYKYHPTIKADMAV